MENIFNDLYEIIKNRKNSSGEGSYTGYLFECGQDKILKKCGEECAEIIIAAKNNKKDEIIAESCDFLYHLFVLLNEKNIPLAEIENELKIRSQKIGNLKEFKKTDKNT